MMCYLRVITASAINIPSVIIGGEKKRRLTFPSSVGRASCQTAVTADDTVSTGKASQCMLEESSVENGADLL